MRPSFRLRLASRLSRDPRKWWAAAVVGVATLVVTTTYLVFQSLIVSPEQAQDRDLGRFGAMIGFGSTSIPPGTEGREPLAEGLRSDGFDNAFVFLDILNVREEGDAVYAREGRWSEEPYPQRYLLRSGEWADEPGEVVIAEREPQPSRLGESVPLLSGRMDLTIVGTALNPFAGTSTTYLLGPGTWAALPATTARQFPTVEAMPVALWAGNRPQQMIAAFSEAHPSPTRVSPAVLRGSIVTSGDILDDSRDDISDRGNPYAYDIPSLGVPLLGVLVWVGLVWRRLLRHRHQLVSLGMSPRAAAQIGSASVIPALLGSTLIAVLLAVAITWSTRPLVASLHDEPLSPMAWPWDPILRCVGIGAAGAVGVYVSLRLWRTRSPRVASRGATSLNRHDRGKFARETRRWVAAFAFAGVAIAAPFANTVTAAMLLAAGCVLLAVALAPDALSALTRAVPTHDFRARMSVRQLTASPSAAAGTAVIAGAVGSAIAFTILLSTLIATMDDRQTPEVLPGQILLRSPDLTLHAPTTPQALQVVNALEATRDMQRIQLRFIKNRPVDAPHVAIAGDDEYLLAVDTTAEAKELLGPKWQDRFDATLESGGLVRWFNAEEGEQASLAGSTATLVWADEDRTLAKLPATNADWPQVNWARGVAGMTLSSTARDLDLPLSDGEVVLTPAGDTVATSVRAALAGAGLDEESAVGFEEPPPPIPPAGLLATAALLSGMALLMVSISAAGRAAELRPTMGVLLANGIAPKWIRECLLLQEGLVLAAGVGVGAVAGIVPVLVSVPRFDGYWVVSIPWGQMSVLLLGCVLGTALASLLTVRRLRPALHSERQATQ